MKNLTGTMAVGIGIAAAGAGLIGSQIARQIATGDSSAALVGIGFVAAMASAIVIALSAKPQRARCACRRSTPDA